MRTTLRTAILDQVTAAKGIAEAAENEDRDLTDVERETIEGHLKKATALQVQGHREEDLRKQMADLTSGLKLATAPDGTDRPVGIATKDSNAAKTARALLGEQFVDSAEYKSLLSSVPGGRFGEKARVQSQPVPVKALLTGTDRDTSAGSLLRTDYRGLLDPFYARPLTIRDLVAAGNTTTDTIEYVRLVSVTNNAAPVPEAQSTAPIGDGTGGTTTAVLGGLKPESGMTFEKDTTTVKTIAHWIPVTKRALSDAAQIRTMIDSFLRYGLEEELEDQLVAGNGVGENFLGLANTSGVQTQAAPSGAQDLLDVTRIARRKVQIGGRAQPTAYVMNPVDWEAIELMRNDNGDFYGAGPFSMTPPRLWGLPVVESEAIPAGTAYVAAWNFAVLYDREQASIQVTDSHADFFIRNLVAILGEFRAAFAVLRPSAFVRIALA